MILHYRELSHGLGLGASLWREHGGRSESTCRVQSASLWRENGDRSESTCRVRCHHCDASIVTEASPLVEFGVIAVMWAWQTKRVSLSSSIPLVPLTQVSLLKQVHLSSSMQLVPVMRVSLPKRVHLSSLLQLRFKVSRIDTQLRNLTCYKSWSQVVLQRSFCEAKVLIRKVATVVIHWSLLKHAWQGSFYSSRALYCSHQYLLTVF